MSASRPTIRDVAAEAGVAVMTVSYAFNRPQRVSAATRARVFDAAERLGYRRPSAVARALRTGRAGQIGVVVGEHLSYAFEDPQAARFLAGVADVCVERGLGMVLIPTHGAAPTALGMDAAIDDVDRLLGVAVDAYVLWTTTTDDPMLDAVVASGLPASIQGGPGREGIVRVGIEDRAAARAIAAAGIAQSASRGPTARPVVVSFPVDRARVARTVRGRDLPDDLSAIPFPVTAARLAGYRDALVAAGYEWADVEIVIVSRNERAAGRKIEDLRGDGRSTLVIAMSDELALGVQDAGVDTRRTHVVTGWDGSEAAAAAGILSVDNPLRAQGRRCAEVALDGVTEPVELSWRVVEPPMPT